MKGLRLFLFLSALYSWQSISGQSANIPVWTWQGGDNKSERRGNYGTLGVADSANKPPARYGAISWTGDDGNLWLMGGHGSGVGQAGSFYAGEGNNTLNDLWSFNTQTKNWTWRSGSKVVIQNGNFGTPRVASPSNMPPSRNGAVSWKGSDGKLWLMGGLKLAFQYGTYFQNDLWSYDPQTGYWTWQGLDSTQTFKQYGVKGVASPNNWPSLRMDAVSWTGKDGKLWLMGGTQQGLSFNDLWSYDPQTGYWTWQWGDSSIDYSNQYLLYGNYGTKGIPNSSNKPGARSEAVSWTGSDGRLWLMGGNGYAQSASGYLNDLWSYDPQTGQWTWQAGDSVVNAYGYFGTKGVASSYNNPRARSGAVSWTGNDGRLWLMGGRYSNQFAYGNLNDLWSYDPQTGNWTWHSGSNTLDQESNFGMQGVADPANVPGARYGHVSWKDGNGRFWLLGGVSSGSSNPGYQNDLWSYDPQTSMWTWQGGDKFFRNQYGNYGIKAVAASSNKPGARKQAATWKTSDNKLWLMGGTGYSDTENGGLNDLWSYDLSSRLWTWQGGDKVVNQKEIYGTKGAADAANKPGSRYSAASWTGADGRLWLMGGQVNIQYGSAYFNDLWSYDPSSGMWTWMYGDSTINSYGSYGTKGLAAANNKPGSRSGAVSWMGNDGRLWLMGGYGYAQSSMGNLNDLWSFNPQTGMWTWQGGDSVVNVSGIYGAKGIAAVSNKPGARTSATSWTGSDGRFWLMGGGTYGSYLNDLWSFDPQIGLWTWESGDSVSYNNVINYGTKGVATATNKPPGRSSAVSWIDGDGRLWLAGGIGAYTPWGDKSYSDVWSYDPQTTYWTWQAGDKYSAQFGIYGTKGVGSYLTTPGDRYGASAWQGRDGRFWLFGGYGSDECSNGNQLNDLWSLDISGNMSNSLTVDNIIGASFCPGTTVEVPFTAKGSFDAGNVFAAQLSNASGFFTSPILLGTLQSTSSGKISCIIPSGIAPGSNYRIRFLASSPGINSADYGIVISPLPVVSFNSGPICPGSSITLNAIGADTYTWSPSSTLSASTGSSVIAAPTINTMYTLTGINTATGCSDTAQGTVAIASFVSTGINIAADITASVLTNTTVFFTAVPSGGGTNPVYQWKKNGQNAGTNSATYSNSSWNNGDVIACTLSSSELCPVGSPANSNAITVSVSSLTYCGSSALSTREYINRFQISNINNTSGNNGGYSNFTNLTARVNKGQAYPFTLEPAWVTTSRNEYYSVWIDYNRNGSFSDAGEAVFTLSKSSLKPINGSITIPSTAQNGIVRMRVSMKYNGAPGTCETNFAGEVEDYGIYITDPPPDTIPPSKPANLTASSITSSSLTLSWAASTDNNRVTLYEIYKDNTLWGTSSVTSVSVTGLNSSTTYKFYVKAKDAANNLSDSSNNIYPTTLGVIYCATSGSTSLREYINRFQLGSINNTSGANASGYGNYLSLSTNLILGSSNPITIIPGWNGTARSEAYRVWIDYNRDGDFLDANEQVFNQNKTTAASISGNIIVPSTVTTGATRLRVIIKYNTSPVPCEAAGFAGEAEDYTVNITSAAFTGQSYNAASYSRTDQPSFEIYPNPVRASEVMLKLNGLKGERVLLYDLSGRVLQEHRFVKRVNIGTLPNGTYIVVVVEKGQIWRRKLVKE